MRTTSVGMLFCLVSVGLCQAAEPDDLQSLLVEVGRLRQDIEPAIRSVHSFRSTWREGRTSKPLRDPY
jgi:hypothetical protein